MDRVISRLFVVVAVPLLISANASAVILNATDTRNTAPPGSLTNRAPWYEPGGADDPRRLLNSGWQYEGDFRGFLGTPISSQYFVTAKHIGGEGDPANSFTYRDVTYPITTAGGFFDAPGSDLRVWKINGTFPAGSWAPLYNAITDGSEIDKPLVVIGRGTQRGAEVRVDGVLKGWQWGADDRTWSWGENVVSGLADFAVSGDQQLLYFDFDRGAGTNESSLSLGDSGGGVFIQSTGVWKLAGINYGVNSPWRFDANGTDFNASIFDAGGLYYNVGSQNSPDWQLVPDGVVGSSFATRISQNSVWLQSVVGPLGGPMVPEPASIAMLMLAAAWTLKRTRPAAV